MATTPPTRVDDSLPGDTGDDEDADNAAEDESDDGDVSDPVEPPESRDEADSGVDPAPETAWRLPRHRR